MKFASFLLIFAFAFSVNAQQQKKKTKLTLDQLPQISQNFLAEYFPENSPTTITRVQKKFETKYKVVLGDLTKLEFFPDGNWKEIKTKMGPLPSGFIPERINEYVSQNYPGTKIIGIENEGPHLEVDLDSGVELEFSHEGVFLKKD